MTLTRLLVNLCLIHNRRPMEASVRGAKMRVVDRRIDSTSSTMGPDVSRYSSSGSSTTAVALTSGAAAGLMSAAAASSSAARAHPLSVACRCQWHVGERLALGFVLKCMIVIMLLGASCLVG
jgi:hypothetical protein